MDALLWRVNKARTHNSKIEIEGKHLPCDFIVPNLSTTGDFSNIRGLTYTVSHW